jgi:hypothetical protein
MGMPCDPLRFKFEHVFLIRQSYLRDVRADEFLDVMISMCNYLALLINICKLASCYLEVQRCWLSPRLVLLLLSNIVTHTMIVSFFS